MRKNKALYLKSAILLTLSLLLHNSMAAQTIKEKKEELLNGSAVDLSPQARELLKTINFELMQKREELRKLYVQTEELFKKNAPTSSYEPLVKKTKLLKSQIDALDNQWRNSIVKEEQAEGYGLWYQPDTTIEQLIIDYGSQDYVYVLPQEIASIQLSIDSNLPVPRASWSEVLELILLHNGVGMEQLNPYVKKLYFLADNHSSVKIVTNRKEELDLFPAHTRVCFVLAPEAADVRRLWFFLDRFVNHDTMVVQLIGRDILLIGSVAEVQDLLKLYEFALHHKGNKEYKLIPLGRVEAEEMRKILEAIFDQSLIEKASTPSGGETTALPQADSNGLKVVPLGKAAQALFLIGTREEISKAEEIIVEVDGQFGGAREKVVFSYTAKYSNAEELASVAAKIYLLMIQENVGKKEEKKGGRNALPPTLTANQESLQENATNNATNIDIISPRPRTPEELYRDDFYQEGSVAINPAPVPLLRQQKKTTDSNRHNFIVDTKTNTIVMVVEADILPKIKELLRKLDVPKKMVQIEVLLFEKRIADSTQFGLNLLRVGSVASQTHRTGLTFSDVLPISGIPNPLNRGLLSFILSRPKEDGPAFDLIYHFLLSQVDVQINACPSVITMNQTPAKYALLEELSLNTGIFEVETNKGVTLKDAFTRAQYGITLEITPTIYMPYEGEEWIWCDSNGNEEAYVALETVVNFDTVEPSIVNRDRPNVIRRNIENEVLIPNGQTVILGGLRRKNTSDSKQSIPFIGELPGIGKLFSFTALEDTSTEMFIFITPKIISDPVEDLERLRYEEMLRRPGDIPPFLCCLETAREWERQALLAGSMRMLFGRPPERCYSPEGEYDGR